MNELKIVLLGSGNVATHLAVALHIKKHKVVQVYSRNITNAQKLASKIDAEAISNLANLEQNADIYIIAVSDNAIAELLLSADFSSKKVVHTAGSVSLNIFSSKIKDAGVLYPFQTFSKEGNINFAEVPLCIEANNSEFEIFLMNFAKQLSDNVQIVHSEKRKILHLSGVFACNFVNHLYYIAGNILEAKDMDAKLLLPLIKETAAKIEKLSAWQAQTGPAVRNDTESLKKHLTLLSFNPEYQHIYKWFSKQIYKASLALNK